MVEVQQSEAERIVAEVKALLEAPALFCGESEEDYYKVMLALAKAFRPKDPFGLIQLSDMTFAETRKNWLRRQQSYAMDVSIRVHHAAQSRRADNQVKSKEDRARDAADQADMSQDTPELRRQFTLECTIDSLVEDSDGLMKNAVEEVAVTRAIKSSIGFYGVLDEFISTDIKRRNECAEWLAWSLDFAAMRSRQDSKKTDGTSG